MNHTNNAFPESPEKLKSIKVVISQNGTKIRGNISFYEKTLPFKILDCHQSATEIIINKELERYFRVGDTIKLEGEEIDNRFPHLKQAVIQYIKPIPYDTLPKDPSKAFNSCFIGLKGINRNISFQEELKNTLDANFPR